MAENHNILFCTDFSEHAKTAFDHAMDQAKKYQAKLHIFHVIMPSELHGISQTNDPSLPNHVTRSSDSEDNLVQQAIGAMKLKYLNLLKDAIHEYEFIAKVGTPDDRLFCATF